LALRQDASALAIVHRRQEGVTATYELAETLERKPKKGAPLDLATVIGEFVAVARRQRARAIVTDYHLLPIAQSLMPADVRLTPWPPGQQGKAEVFVTARNLFRAGAVRLPASASGVVAQMCAVTSTPNPGGGIKISQPRRAGSHGDVACAVALALYAATKGGARDLQFFAAGSIWSAGGPGVRVGSGARGKDYSLPPEERMRRFLNQR
jgi:hypothetical protein